MYVVVCTCVLCLCVHVCSVCVLLCVHVCCMCGLCVLCVSITCILCLCVRGYLLCVCVCTCSVCMLWCVHACCVCGLCVVHACVLRACVHGYLHHHPQGNRHASLSTEKVPLLTSAPGCCGDRCRRSLLGPVLVSLATPPSDVGLPSARGGDVGKARVWVTVRAPVGVTGTGWKDLRGLGARTQ